MLYIMETKEAKNAKLLLERIKSSKKILKCNKDLIIEFYNEKVMTGVKLDSLAYPLRISFLLGEYFKKPFKQITKKELQKFFAELKPAKHNWTGKAEKEYAPRTLWAYMSYVKGLWKWIYGLGEGEGYPEAVRWIRRSCSYSALPRKRPINVLTREEVLEMIKNAGNPRDKAIVAVLFEAGLRAKELLEMRFDELNHEETHCTFKVVGKGNRPRTVLLEWSYPYLKVWLEFLEKKRHLVKPEFREFIWISFPYCGVKKIKKTVNGRLMDRDSLRTVVKNIAEKAGIKKRVWNHGFRHSSATDFVKQGYNEAELRLKYGWSKKSSIPHEYTHYDFDELMRKILIKDGKLKPTKEEKTNVLKTKKCLYCGTDCGSGSMYCPKCGNPLNFQLPKERREEKGLELMQATLEKFKELEEKGVDLKQFNSFIETWVKSNSKADRKEISKVIISR